MNKTAAALRPLLIALLIAITVLAGAVPSAVGAVCLNTVYVDVAAGNDSWDGSSPTHTAGSVGPKQTIQAGVDAVCSGGTVRVAAGTYNLAAAPVTIAQSLTLAGAGQNATIINGLVAHSAAVVLDLISPGAVTISALTVQNGQWSGIYVDSECGNVTLNDCAVVHNTSDDYGGGICVEGGNTLNLNRCIVSYNSVISHPFTLETGRTLGDGLDTYGCGGGIYLEDGTLNMTGCTVNANEATGHGSDVSGSGGGIVILYSAATVNGCSITGNSARSGGGSFGSDELFINVSGSGGGIASVSSALTMTDCTIAGNSASSLVVDAGQDVGDIVPHFPTSMSSGAGMASVDSNVTLDRCTLSSNSADAFGGGIVAVGTGALYASTAEKLEAFRAQPGPFDGTDNMSITNCSIVGNSAGWWGGGVLDLVTPLYISKCNINSNTAERAGGGIFIIGSGLLITGLNISTIDSLSSLSGTANLQGLPRIQGSMKDGKLLNAGQPVLGLSYIADSTIANNSCGNWGGGLATLLSFLEVERCTFSANAAGIFGGGIGNLIAESLIVNCTINGNRLTYAGQTNLQAAGASATVAPLPPLTNAGGGVATVIGYVGLLNDTIAGNSTATDADSYGGGIFVSRAALNEIENTIVAGNSAQHSDSSNGLVRGVVLSYGHNIDGGNSCHFDDPADQVNTNPLLGPLQNNGGPTFTQAIGANSPAFNRGSEYAPPTDQRGVARPQVGISDIGAFELALSESAFAISSVTHESIRFSTSGGAIINVVGLPPTACSGTAPPGMALPYGLFSFTVVGIVPGSTVNVTITFPHPLPANITYWKCRGDGTWVNVMSLATYTPGDTRLVLHITDGGLGDADGIANGSISDPGGPALPVKAGPTSHGSSMPPAPSANAVLLPSISIKSAALSGTKVAPGAPVTVTADVANTGAVNGATRITLYVNGQEESSQGITVNSGSNTRVTFTLSRNDPGTYNVYVGGTPAGSFAVDDFSDPNIILYISMALVLFALAGGLILVLRRRQSGY